MGSHRPRHSTRASPARSALPTPKTVSSDSNHALREEIRRAAQQLRLAYCVAVATEVALRTGNCAELEKVAACMPWGALDSIGKQIERLSTLLVQLGGNAAGLP